jgi:uncharacterized protein (TIGR02246 family)
MEVPDREQRRLAAEAAVEAHLAAIKARDLDAYLATLHPEVTTVTTSGDMLSGIDEVAEFHREWFTDSEWTYSVEPIRTAYAAGAITRFVTVTYRGHPTATPSRFVMGLTFVAEDNGWLLVHDQCTVPRSE